MVFGVPIIPLFIVAFSIGFLSILTTVLLNFLTIGAVFIMRMIVKNDDQKFRIIGLWLSFRLQDMNRVFWMASAYSPVVCKKRWNP